MVFWGLFTPKIRHIDHVPVRELIRLIDEIEEIKFLDISYICKSPAVCSVIKVKFYIL